MYPVLFTLFGYQITSFGVFLILGILSSLFVLWRLAHIYELDAEKVLDIFFITTIVSFIGARIFYIATHLIQFETISKMFLFFKYPGLSFWGALIAAMIVVRLVTPKFKLNSWQLADLGIVAAFLMISITSFGCLFGGCQYGTFYDGWFAVNQFGLAGQRFPLQLLEASLFILGFIYLWHASLRFHFNGRIAAVGLMILAFLKLILEPMRGDTDRYFYSFSFGTLFSVGIFLVGLIIFYRQSRRSFKADLKFLRDIFMSTKKRNLVILKLRRSWYNFYVNTHLSYTRWRKGIEKQFRVRSTPTKF